MTARILPTDTPELFQAAVKIAAQALRAGELVALPTETVYGLAANALDSKAVSEIYRVKGRPAHNPIIVHVDGVAMARECVADWPPPAARVAAAFWPGPLTLVLPRAKQIPDLVTAGGSTVGVRQPSHPFIHAVIRECGFPLAAPSANLANRVSPTHAAHVRRQLGGKIPLIVDGGQCQVGIESTVLDLTTSPPRILRPGMIQEDALASVLGELGTRTSDSGPLRSPGLLPKHYAPLARLVLRDWQDEKDLLEFIFSFKVQPSDCCVIAHTRIPGPGGFARVGVIPHDPEAFARAIYSELHRCDETGARLIVVESLPETREWMPLADRLRKAAAP